MEVETQLSILKELAAHEWNPDYPTDLGITSVYGIPRLGMQTPRHMPLAMLINYHVRRLLKTDVQWSTIAIDASNEERTPQYKHRRTALVIIFVIGTFARGDTYSLDEAAKLKATDVGAGMCFTAPYATRKHDGMKVTIELHNRHAKRRTSGEDLDGLAYRLRLTAVP